MAFIEIYEGNFPAQTGSLIKKSALIPQTTLMLKGNRREQILYNARNALQSVEVITPDPKKPGIKIVLKDKKIIVGKTEATTLEDIRLIIAAGPDDTGDLFIVTKDKLKENYSFVAQAGRALAWVSGGILGLFGIILITDGPAIMGVVLLVLATSIIPPVLSKVPLFKNKTPFAKAVSILLLGIIILLIGGIMSGQQKIEQAQKTAEANEKSEAEREAKKKEFEAIKDSILTQARTALEKKDYQGAVDTASPYVGLENAALDEIHATARQKLDEIVRAEAEAQNRKAEAAKLIDEVKAYEHFLDNDEATFKAIKPSEADLDTIRKATSTFSALAESLNKARQNKKVLSAADIVYLKGVEKRLSAFQQKILPGLRLGFKKRASELLWQYDTEVSISGTGNKVIGFYAGEFSLNANIQAAQEQLHEILTKLRFTQARYAWYKNAPGYAYKLDTPSDAKLAYFLHGEFQDMAAGY